MFRVSKREPVIGGGKGRAVNFRGKWPKSNLERVHSGTQAHPHIRTAMVAVGERDQGRAPGVISRNLDRVFNSFAAGREKQRLLFEFPGGQCIQTFRELDVSFIGADLKAGMGECLGLLFNRGDHLGMTMADILASNTTAEIDIAVALDIPTFSALGPGCNKC